MERNALIVSSPSLLMGHRQSYVLNAMSLNTNQTCLITMGLDFSKHLWFDAGVGFVITQQINTILHKGQYCTVMIIIGNRSDLYLIIYKSCVIINVKLLHSVEMVQYNHFNCFSADSVLCLNHNQMETISICCLRFSVKCNYTIAALI